MSGIFSNLESYGSLLPKEAPSSLAELDPQLCIYRDARINVWYSPLSAYTSNPDLWILGLTPGWNQAKLAYEAAAELLARGDSPESAIQAAKPRVAFAGSMRRNLVNMMDELGFPECLGVSSSSELFGTSKLRTGSALKYPVFRGTKNYSGSNPRPLRHPVLHEMVDTIFSKDLMATPDCLVLPLGKAVEGVVEYAIESGLVDKRRVIRGFPHPSGANGSRTKQYSENKASLASQIEAWYSRST